MDFKAVFSEDSKFVDVHIRNAIIRCDNSVVKGGTGRAPNPGTFLYTAVASCAAATAYNYCINNNLPLPLEVHVQVDESSERSGPGKITFEIMVPADFPNDHLRAVQIAADACWVKRQWLDPPEFETIVKKR